MITYEQVVKVTPQVDRPRPILLVAPRGGPFNMEDLTKRLISGAPDRYGTPVPRKALIHSNSLFETRIIVRCTNCELCTYINLNCDVNNCERSE